jgi:uncharacterized membrane protein
VDIADNGTVVGNSHIGDFKFRAVRFPGNSTVTEELPPLPGRVESIAVDINSAGTVVGKSDSHAARWLPDGQVEAFPTPPDTTSNAVAIDRWGTALVTVWTFGAPESHYRWTATGQVIPQPSPPDFLVQDLSDTGTIIGAFSVGGGGRRAATLAPDGTTEDLGALPGDVDTLGNAINATGDTVVGYSGSTTGRRPVAWRFCPRP